MVAAITPMPPPCGVGLLCEDREFGCAKATRASSLHEQIMMTALSSAATNAMRQNFAMSGHSEMLIMVRLLLRESVDQMAVQSNSLITNRLGCEFFDCQPSRRCPVAVAQVRRIRKSFDGIGQ